MTTTKELVQYLKNILFHSGDAPLEDPGFDFDDPMLKQLGEGLHYLAWSFEQFKQYANALSIGNLSVDFPPKENLFCAPLKNLHANLNHLTWQAQQIAGGDYSQQIDYLGDFSIAFNQMTTQLKEREALLKHYAKKKENQANQLLTYNELLMNLMNGRQELILVINPVLGKLLYCNKIPYQSDQDMMDAVNAQPQIQYFLNQLAESGYSIGSRELYNPDTHLAYFINSFQLDWEGEPGMAFIIEDITKEREDEKRLSDLAYKDAYTGIFNRRYLIENMTELLEAKSLFSFCYIDINHLKSVNDTYGHGEGDKYIMSIVNLIQDSIRETDLLTRIGGDEFGLLLLNCSRRQAEKKMKRMYTDAIRLSHSIYPYDVSFSYGIVEVPSGSDDLCIEAIINAADAAMYSFKETSKS